MAMKSSYTTPRDTIRIWDRRILSNGIWRRIAGMLSQRSDVMEATTRIELV